MIHESQDGGNTHTSRPSYATIDSVVKVTDSDYIKFLEDKIHALQLEISDEEIEKAVNEYADAYQCPSEVTMCKHDIVSAWNNAIKWYREQLKQRQ